MTTPPFPGYLVIAEAARQLGVHYRTVDKLVRSGRLKAEKVFNVWLIHEGAIEALLADGYTGRTGRKEK